jgi:hypothetical protein
MDSITSATNEKNIARYISLFGATIVKFWCLNYYGLTLGGIIRREHSEATNFGPPEC